MLWALKGLGARAEISFKNTAASCAGDQSPDLTELRTMGVI